MKTESFDNLGHTHNSHILFVGKDEESRVLKFFFWKHFLKFLSSNFYPLFVWWVDNIN